MRHLENKRFGRLIVMRRFSSKMWLCKCDCGSKKLVSTYCLTSGMTRSCGCLQKESRLADITGQRFGRLVALEPTSEIKNNSVIWRFKCDCGKECEATVDSVKWRSHHSCGCLQHESKVKQALNMQNNVERVEGTTVNNIVSNKIYVNNTSGYKGVSWHKTEQRWVARIQFKGKIHHLGYFDKIEDAAAARTEAEQRLHDPFLEWYMGYKQREKNVNE